MIRETNGDTLIYLIPSQLNFLNAGTHIDRIKKIVPKYKIVIFALRFLFHIDLDGIDALEEMISIAERTSIVILSGCKQSGTKKEVEEGISKRPWFQEKMREGLVFKYYVFLKVNLFSNF